MTTKTLPLNFDQNAYVDNDIDIYALARMLGVSLGFLGDLTGLPARVIYDPEARLTPDAQAQLRDFIDILEILMPKAGSVDELVDMVASERISALSNYTIRRLFHAGRSRHVLKVLRSAAFPLRSSTGGRFDVPVVV
ncbi:hypothetical protein J7355_15450 [Endozoicomonas sp. G2_2]|uniref:hypothetical protein n=1 Tax=Endozoicomonas sp. G2_2 TaxID=2821092 RepID=UPI001ADB0EDF|nr:hypothetical protein [Endozoicomonas sp. G2_2]MBO9471484.1 hypothetical protein [Endozoicomonas sp. G2_2]